MQPGPAVPPRSFRDAMPETSAGGHVPHVRRQGLYAPLVTDAASAHLSSHRFVTAPNLFTLVRLCCIPLFLYLLFGLDHRAGAAWLLGGLGATDWVDGWLARRLHQTSEFGKVFDPTADRLLFIVGIGGI